MLNYDTLISLLKENQKFVITTHVNPDADAIGSEIAVAGILKQLGKEYYIFNTSVTPYNLHFMDVDKSVKEYDQNKHKDLLHSCDVAIFLDLNSLNRTVRIENDFRLFEGKLVCIDHHTEPEHFADLELIDESKSSTGEMIYDMITNTEILDFTDEIALAIYAAIMTDTGSFRFSKTTAELHNKVANLLKYNLKPEEIYDEIYAKYDFSRIKLLGEALSTIKLSGSKEISYMVVTQKNLKESKGIESDVDGFVNFALTTNGVKIGILFFELKDGIKISFRSKDDIPVNKLAQEFGGGGHLNAAGTRLHNVKLDDILPKVISSAEKILIQKY